MFRTGTSSTEFKNEPRAETGSAILGHSSYQQSESFTLSSPESESQSRAISESAMIVREIREGTLSAFVGAGTTITAELFFKSLLRVDGLLCGRITSDAGTLVVAATGRVEANVAVAIARIHGTVTGDIVCSERIELGAAARVKGNIKAPTLMMEPGAVLDGRCRMTTQEPEPEVVSEPVTAVAAETKAVAETEPLSEPATAAAETVAKLDAVAAPAETSVSESATAAPSANAAKTPKVARKANVLGAKPRRTRAKVAVAKTANREP